MKKWKQKIRYAAGTAAGLAAFFVGTIPAAAATHTAFVLPGSLKPIHLIIPGIAVLIGIIAFLYGKFHKRDDD